MMAYDPVKHSDLGAIAEQYFVARAAYESKTLLRSGLVHSKRHAAELQQHWSRTNVLPEAEPFAVDFAAWEGIVRATIYTRAHVNDKIDAHRLVVERVKGRWVLVDCYEFTYRLNGWCKVF